MTLQKIRLSIKQKIILAFLGINLLVIAAISFTLHKFSEAVTLSKEVIEIHQPAAINSIQLIKELKIADTLVEEYLLTGDTVLKDKFYTQKEHILKTHQDVITAPSGIEILHVDNTFSIATYLDQFFDYADKLFQLRENDLENYPGIALASELTDPYTLAYLGLVNELIDTDHDFIPVKNRQDAEKLLYELRYSWIQMNNAFRIFMLTRNDNDLNNFHTYSEINRVAHERLREINIQFDFDYLSELEGYRNERLKNVPIVVKAFRNEGWRQDIYILRTEVIPLLNKMFDVLQKHSDKQIAISTDDGELLTKTLHNSRTLAILILLISSAFSILLTALIVRSLKPIAELTTIANNISINETPNIKAALLERQDEVGELATAFYQMSRNIKEDVHKLNIAEKKFETLLESSSDAMVISDQNGKIMFFNRQAESMFGYTKLEIIGNPIETLLPEQYRDNHKSYRQNFIERPEMMPMGGDFDFYGVRKDGSKFSVEIGLAPIETSEGLLISASIRDVTDKKESQRRLVHQANYDLLTDLPNRVLALDRLSIAIANTRRKQHSIAIMFIDLDNFKQVNDTLGHTVGDQLLVAVSKRLLDTVRANDTVARLGGDEFLVILPESNDIGAIETIADKLITTICERYVLDGRELFIGASIGITLYPADSDDPEVLLRNADAAMYQSKNAGRNTYRFFTQEMNAQLLHRLEMESQLRSALDKGELTLQYQPLYDISQNKITAVEALLRWHNPQLGQVSPDIFIPVADETGLINKIGAWVLHEACHTTALRNKQIGYPLRVSVNISAMQFRGSDLVQLINNELSSSGLNPELLELEITERALVDDNPNVNRIINDIRRLGVRLALDDFGTGYSSLGYLKRFQFNSLKIDRIFVSDVIVDAETSALCKAIVSMAKSLNLTVVAEGIENTEQLQFMRKLGVDYVQGFFLSKPVSSDEIINLIKKRNNLIRPV